MLLAARDAVRSASVFVSQSPPLVAVPAHVHVFAGRQLAANRVGDYSRRGVTQRRQSVLAPRGPALSTARAVCSPERFPHNGPFPLDTEIALEPVQTTVSPMVNRRSI